MAILGDTIVTKITSINGFIGNGSQLTALNASNISSGTLAAARLATSGATAGSYGESAAKSPGFSGSFNIPYVTVDTYGRVTAIANKAITLPSNPNTDTKNTAGSTDTSSKIFLIGATSQAANPQTYSHDTAFVDTNGRLNSAAPASDANDTTVATTKWVKDQSYTTASGHSHNYAGSSSAGGAATSLANFKVTTTANNAIDTPGSNAIAYASGLTKANWNYQQTDGSYYCQWYNASWWHEIFGDYRTGQISVRGNNNGTKTNWRRVLDESNYSTIIGTTYLTASSTLDATKLSGTIPSSCYTNSDTKNTAGSTDTSSKIFLVGATSQAANPQTYSHDTAFVDTNGRLNSAAPASDANDTTVATTKWVKDRSYITSSASITGTSANVTGTVAIANGGTGATTRLNAVKALTNEDVGTNATYFLTITNSWGKAGYTSVANAKTVLGLGSAAYTASTAYAAASHGNHVPATQTANNAIFLRNDNTWQTVTPANIGALAAGGTAADSSKLGGTAAASYAKLASPALTGTPTAPTAANRTNSTQIATTAFVFNNAARHLAANTTIYVSSTAAGTKDGSSAANAMSITDFQTYVAATTMNYSTTSLDNSRTLTVCFVPTGSSYGNFYIDTNKMPGVRNLIITTSTGTNSTTSNYSTNSPLFGNIYVRGSINVTLRNIEVDYTICSTFGAEVTLDTYIGAARFQATYRGVLRLGNGTYNIHNKGTDVLFYSTEYGELFANTATMTINFRELCYYSSGIFYADSLSRNYIYYGRMKFTGTQPVVTLNASGTLTGTSSTAAGTAAKAVTLADGQTFTLTSGAVAYVKFTNTNTAANPTLNINSTGAKPIFFNGAAIPANYLNSYIQYKVTYDGTNFVCNNAFQRVEVAANSSYEYYSGNYNQTYNSGSWNWTNFTRSWGSGANVNGTLQSNLSGTASNATNVTTTKITLPSSATNYYLTASSSDSTNTAGLSKFSTNARLQALNGTTSAEGRMELILGNATATGTAGNVTGRVSLYNNKGKYTLIIPHSGDTSDRTIYTPKAGGTLIVHTTDTAIGSSKKPVYITADGVASAIGYTIEKDVPSNAVFTDHTYSNFVKSGSTAAAGLVPSPGTTAGTTKYLREDATWQVPPNDNTDTKVTSTATNPSSTATWYPIASSSSSTETNTTVKSSGIKYQLLYGTTSAEGTSELQLGNTTATGTAGNMSGAVILYNDKGKYTSINPHTGDTSNRKIYTPKSGGTIVVATTDTAVGSAHKFVYINGNSVATAADFEIWVTND